jgi:hypothetical protein
MIGKKIIKKIEKSVGEEFIWTMGGKEYKIKVIEDNKNLLKCSKCWFANQTHTISLEDSNLGKHIDKSCDEYACTKLVREDGKNVYFKKIK